VVRCRGSRAGRSRGVVTVRSPHGARHGGALSSGKVLQVSVWGPHGGRRARRWVAKLTGAVARRGGGGGWFGRRRSTAARQLQWWMMSMVQPCSAREGGRR
jgi:hypothetical protein